MTPRLRAIIDGAILLLPTLIFRSIKCCFKNEEVKTRNTVLESLIFDGQIVLTNFLRKTCLKKIY